MKPRILIVDDDPSIIDTVGEILTEAGYEVLAAINPDAGLIIAKKELPDLIITDWEMPEISGIDFIKRIKKVNNISQIPVVVITGKMTLSVHLKTAMEAGAVDFIRKPVDRLELLARTKSMVLLSTLHKENIQKKNKELTILSKTIMQHEQALDKYLRRIQAIISKYENENRKVFSLIEKEIKTLSFDTKRDTWHEFEKNFNNTYPFFVENLTKSFPNLSSRDIQLCLFLKLNMSSKEIASYSNKEVTSIDVARYRLRKKLNLPKDVALNHFLSTY